MEEQHFRDINELDERVKEATEFLSLIRSYCIIGERKESLEKMKKELKKIIDEFKLI